MSDAVIFQQNPDTEYIHPLPANMWVISDSRTEIKQWMQDAGFIYGNDYGRWHHNSQYDWEHATMSLWFSRASTLEWFLMKWG
jgi:hypothetical protein